MFNNKEYQKQFLTATATQVFTGRGTFHGIVIGTTATTAVQLCDATGINTNNGTFMILKASIAEGSYMDIDTICVNGLYVTNSITGSYTIVYSQP